MSSLRFSFVPLYLFVPYHGPKSHVGANHASHATLDNSNLQGKLNKVRVIEGKII